jgi:hypothetical protein
MAFYFAAKNKLVPEKLQQRNIQRLLKKPHEQDGNLKTKE